MSVTQRGRVVSYDNLKSGSASGQERTSIGGAPPAENVGGTALAYDNPKSGSAFPTSVIPDNISSGNTTPTIETLD